MRNKFIGTILRWMTIAKQPYSQVDPKIQPLVEKMNSSGLIKTVASCEGHRLFGKPPYVYFKASASTAALIEKLLREAVMLDDKRFQQEWIIEGRFDERYELTFLLYSPTYHEKSHSIWTLVFYGLVRKRIDAELLSLVSLVEEATLLSLWDSDKPQVTPSCNHNEQA